MTEQRCGLVEQTLSLIVVARRQCDPRKAAQGMPRAPVARQCPESFDAAPEMVAGRGETAFGVFDVSEHMISLRRSLLVSGAGGQRPSASEHRACAREFPSRVAHQARRGERSQLGDGRDGWQGQNLLVPPETFARMPSDQPKQHQRPRNVGRFSRTALLDEPRQRAAVILEIVTHAIQPFTLRWPDQPLRGEGGFAGAIVRQALQCVVALARRGELERRKCPHGLEHLV